MTDSRITMLSTAMNVQTSTHALGSGDWSIEVRDGDEFLFELVGSNGSRNDEPADDLWGKLQELENLALMVRRVNKVNASKVEVFAVLDALYDSMSWEDPYYMDCFIAQEANKYVEVSYCNKKDIQIMRDNIW